MDGDVIRRTESHFAGAGRRTLFRRAWLSPRPERLVLLVHGFAEHSGRYDTLGSWLATRGSAVHAFDQQGHGHSDGPRGYVRRFEDFLDDLDACLERSRGEHPSLPAFVVGHSMGGLVVVRWATTRSPDVSAVAASGPALAVANPPSPAQRLLLRMLRRVAPKAALGGREIDPSALSRDPEVGRAYLADPLVFQKLTVSLAAELFAAGQRAIPEASRVQLPMLLLHGGQDPLCLPEGSRALFAGLRTPGSDLRIYPELRHEIFNEPEREQVFADLLEWVRKREAGS